MVFDFNEKVFRIFAKNILLWKLDNFYNEVDPRRKFDDANSLQTTSETMETIRKTFFWEDT